MGTISPVTENDGFFISNCAEVIARSWTPVEKCLLSPAGGGQENLVFQLWQIFIRGKIAKVSVEVTRLLKEI